VRSIAAAVSPMQDERVPNRLAGATSPYLLQHRNNPVDWREWSPEAFAEAERRDVPVLLSVGYAACHWCHVMAHESFEDEATAAVMNDNFVNVKVDREERPDVDAVYMEATQAMTGHGGWPMTVFCTPAGEPFYCGTYFPPQPRHGMPSFAQVLAGVAEAWRDRREQVREVGADIVRRLSTRTGLSPGPSAPTPDQLDTAVRVLRQEFDYEYGGFGGAPKFPPSMVLEFLLRHHARTGDVEALRMVDVTCERMARGGMYDQLGGGFARYSVDNRWVVPHFEKMLYDNALLLRVYLHWYRATGSPLAERIARETADWMLRDLRTAEGGFASALDADSEGVEGRYYVWTPDEVGEDAAQLFSVTTSGTFEHGTSVLQLLQDPPNVETWKAQRARLLSRREQRVPPSRDDKVVAAWNGLAVAALAETGALLEVPAYVSAATAAAELLVRVHFHEGRLTRTSRGGQRGTGTGVLEDYADVAEGFLTLCAVTGDARWLGLAGELLDVALDRFPDDAGGFFDTADDAERLVRRPQDPTDNATPSGQSALAGALLTYSGYTASTRHREAAERALGVTGVLAQRFPRYAGWGLAVAEALLDGPREVAVVGPADDEDTAALRRTALTSTAPGLVLALGEPSDGIPLLRDRPLVHGRPAAYVCRRFVCDRPVTNAVELRSMLSRTTS
jgi:uncharacterized protein